MLQAKILNTWQIMWRVKEKFVRASTCGRFCSGTAIIFTRKRKAIFRVTGNSVIEVWLYLKPRDSARQVELQIYAVLEVRKNNFLNSREPQRGRTTSYIRTHVHMYVEKIEHVAGTGDRWPWNCQVVVERQDEKEGDRCLERRVRADSAAGWLVVSLIWTMARR